MISTKFIGRETEKRGETTVPSRESEKSVKEREREKHIKIMKFG